MDSHWYGVLLVCHLTCLSEKNPAMDKSGLFTIMFCKRNPWSHRCSVDRTTYSKYFVGGSPNAWLQIQSGYQWVTVCHRILMKSLNSHWEANIWETIPDVEILRWSPFTGELGDSLASGAENLQLTLIGTTGSPTEQTEQTWKFSLEVSALASACPQI